MHNTTLWRSAITILVGLSPRLWGTHTQAGGIHCVWESILYSLVQNPESWKGFAWKLNHMSSVFWVLGWKTCIWLFCTAGVVDTGWIEKGEQCASCVCACVCSGESCDSEWCGSSIDLVVDLSILPGPWFTDLLVIPYHPLEFWICTSLG